MRFARPVAVALLLLLAVAPAASAHNGGEIDHRDTPADLAGADITRALAASHFARTVAPDLPQYLPTTWCGTRLTSDDTVHAAFPASQRQIKVVYAYAPNGGADNSAQWRDALQASVSRIEQYLALQSGGRRALRFDMGNECGPQYLDIEVVALTQARAYYLDDFYRVANEVRDAIGHDSRDVFVVADNLTDGTRGVYGTGEVIPDADQPDAANPHNDGGFTGIMWMDGTTAPNPSGWQPTVMLHEITHNLGGVQQSAPHRTSSSHCTDGEDVMCYPDGSPEAASYNPNVCPMPGGAIPQTYDCGRDDYYNPDPVPGSYLATHWNVYRSAFMGSCTQLGMACGDNIVPTVPVNTSVPTIAGTAKRGQAVVANVGAWLNAPTTYALQWQRAAGSDWANIAGATSPTYVPASADVGAAVRIVVTATNDDGAAVAASAPTAPIADVAAALPVPRPAGLSVRIALRDRARHQAGTLAAKITPVPAGREVRTAAARVALPAGTWRLRLCAGPKSGSLRCVLTKRVRTRTRGVRLPSALLVVRGTTGALRITAAAVDRRQRVRARGQAATA